jgi:hypothetical protein
VTAEHTPAAARHGHDTTRFVAECLVELSGDVRLRLPVPADAVGDGARLLVRERRDAEGRYAVRVPLTPGPLPGTGWEAVLRRCPDTLTEGRWDLHAEYRTARGTVQRRLRAGLRDLRSLLSPLAPPPALPLVSWVPYRTAGGWLSVRAWLRHGHAEVLNVGVSRDALAVEGWLLGENGGKPPVLRLRCRQAPERVVAVTAAPHPAPGPRWEGTGQGFRCSFAWMDLAEVASDGDVWDVFAQSGDGAPEVRVARLLDDIQDKKDVYSFPSAHVWATARGPLRISPYYTSGNGLSVRSDLLMV